MTITKMMILYLKQIMMKLRETLPPKGLKIQQHCPVKELSEKAQSMSSSLHRVVEALLSSNRFYNDDHKDDDDIYIR